MSRVVEESIVGGINKLSVEVVYVDPTVIGVGIIGQVITQGVINGGMNIGSNIVTDNVAANNQSKNRGWKVMQ